MADKFQGLINYIKTNCPQSDQYCNFYQDFDNSYKSEDGSIDISIGYYLDDEGLSVKYTDANNRLICSRFLGTGNWLLISMGGIQWVLETLELLKKDPLKYYREELQSRTTHYYTEGLPLHTVSEAITELEEREYYKIDGAYTNKYKDLSNRFIFYHCSEGEHDIFIFKSEDEVIKFVNDSFFEAE